MQYKLSKVQQGVLNALRQAGTDGLSRADFSKPAVRALTGHGVPGTPIATLRSLMRLDLVEAATDAAGRMNRWRAKDGWAEL